MEDVRSKTYSPERITATIPVEQFLQDYVDVPRFWSTAKRVRVTRSYGPVLRIPDVWRSGTSMRH